MKFVQTFEFHCAHIFFSNSGLCLLFPKIFRYQQFENSTILMAGALILKLIYLEITGSIRNFLFGSEFRNLKSFFETRSHSLFRSNKNLHFSIFCFKDFQLSDGYVFRISMLHRQPEHLPM